MKTAVEWLQAEFNKWAEGKVFIPQDFIEKAKKLEKEQIVKSFNDGHHADVGHVDKAWDYYNQTYNN